MSYRKTTDPVVKIRRCRDCRAVIAGFTERGLVTWCDVTPITRQLEVIYHAGNRPTYLCQPRPGRTAWLDWRNPATATEPSRGIILVGHPHSSPDSGKAPEPPWLAVDYRITLADPDEGQGAFPF